MVTRPYGNVSLCFRHVTTGNPFFPCNGHKQCYIHTSLRCSLHPSCIHAANVSSLTACEATPKDKDSAGVSPSINLEGNPLSSLSISSYGRQQPTLER